MALSKKKVLATFKRDLAASDSNKQEWDKEILKWSKEFNGDPYGNERKDKAKVVSRDIKKAAAWQHASIIDPFVNNENVVNCVPVTHSDTKAAEQAELLLNYQFCRDFPRYNFVSDSFKILQREGTVVARVSWEFQEEEVMVTEPVMMTVPVIDPMRAQQMAQQGLPPYEEIQVGTKQIPTMKTTQNRPRVEIMRNSMLWIDPTAEGCIEDAKFVIYKFNSSLSELRKDGRYENLDDIMIDGRVVYDSDSPYYRDETFMFEDKPRQQIEVVEYWGNFDMNEDGIAEPVVCTWVGDTIIRMEPNPYPDQVHPFVSCAYDSDPFSIYGISQGDTISTDQKIKTGIKRAILDTLDASTNGQKGVRKGTIDVANKRKFNNGDDFEFLGSSADFWEGKFNTIPTDVLNFYQTVDQDIQNLTGVRPFGASNGPANLNNGSQGVGSTLDAAARREMDISRNYKENFLLPIMRKWHSMDVAWLDEEQIIRITDEQFVAIQPDDLEGRIDISMNVSTQETNNEKSNNLSFMLQTMAQSLPFDLTKILLAEQASLKGMPELAKKIEEFQQQPDPKDEQMKDLEMQKLQSEINERNSRVGENHVDSRLKEAKAVNEEAKARASHSNADMTDLDFLRKQEGTDRAEALDDERASHRSKSKLQAEQAGLNYMGNAQILQDTPKPQGAPKK